MKIPASRRFPLPVLGVVLIGLVLSESNFAQNAQPSGFLETASKLTKDQIAKVGSGHPLALTLATSNKSEIGAIGAVRIQVPADFFVAQYQNIQEFKKTSGVLQVGRFSDPAAETDMASLVVDAGELRALQSCKPGKCSVKISATLLANYRRLAGKSTSFNQMSAAFRQTLADYVNDYRRRGDDALLIYNDQSPGVNVAGEFHDLLGGFKALREYALEFADYLEGKPDRHLENVEDFIYWSKEDAGFKALTSLTHVTIYRKIIQDRAWYFIAAKNIYSTHYLESSLSVSAISEDPVGGCWVVYINRSRTDILRGWLSSVRRSIIESRVKSAMLKQLTATRKQLEVSFQKPKN